MQAVILWLKCEPSPRAGKSSDFSWEVGLGLGLKGRCWEQQGRRCRYGEQRLGITCSSTRLGREEEESECRWPQISGGKFGLCLEGSREPLTTVERSLAELIDTLE